MTNKKPEDMTTEELEEYHANLKREVLLRETAVLEKAKLDAEEKAKAEQEEKLRLEGEERYKKEQLAKLANQDKGSVDAGEKLQTSKTPVNREEQAIDNRMYNNFERDKVILNLPENRKIEGLSVEEVYERLKSGYYKKP